MKRRTQKQLYADIADAVTCINKGVKVKRSTYKDGSIPTRPVVPVRCPYPEKDVVHDCLVWLRKHHIMCNRHGCGSFINEHGQRRMYGIKGAGDIIGMIGVFGKHFEIECKRGLGGKLSPGQQQRMKDVRRNHGLYFIVHGVEELENFLGEEEEDDNIT